MASQPCDGCGRRVSLAGGIANLWSFESSRTEGLSLELADGSEHFLCFECVDDLPDEPTASDVASLPERPPAEAVAVPDEAGGGAVQYVGLGIAVGAGAGAAVGVATGDLEPWLATGAAVGLGLALLAGRLAERRGQ